jgi:LemA protein
MKLSTGWIVVIVIIVILFFLGMWSVSSYNRLVSKEEKVSSAWANVQTQYQRRADLIPNLVATVKGAANFETTTLTAVIEARAKATSVNINPKNLDEASLQKFQAAQDGLSSALSRLMVVVERYPELKATQNFSDLQSQLEGTENRISVSRREFNEIAQDFNASIRRFPGNIIAGMAGFSKKAYFEAQKEAETTPKVQF